MKMMIRLTLLSMLVMLVMVPATSGTLAQEASDPLDLAQYAPADTSIFVAVRTDAGYFESIDALIASVLAKFPPEVVGELEMEPTVENILNEAIFPARYDFETGEMVDPENNFADDVRPWLGDNIAAILPSLDAILFGAPDVSAALVMDIADKDATIAFFTDNVFADDIENGNVVVTEQEDGSVLFDYTLDSSALLVTDDTAFITTGTAPAIVLPGEDATSLDSTAAFSDTVGALPADGYNAVVYLDASPLVESLGSMLPMILGPEASETMDPAMMAQSLGQQAIGFTLLEDRAMVVDMVANGEIPAESDPLDLDMLEMVPADALLVAEGDDLGTMIQSSFEMLVLADDLLTEFGVLPADETSPLAELGPDDIATFLTLSFEGTYGLSLDETLAWMNGDHVLYVRMPLLAEGSLLGDIAGFTLDEGFILATDNPDATAEFIAAIAEQAMSAYATATFEDGTLTVPLGDLFSMPEVGKMVVTSNDTILATGSAETVALALEPGEENLTTTPGYVFESELFLPETEMLLYVDVAPIIPAFEALVERNPEAMMEEDAAIMDILLNLVDTASITATTEDGTVVLRMALTLGE